MNDKTDEAQQQGVIPYREPIGAKDVTAFIPADFPSVFRFSQLLAESGDMVPKAYIANPAKIATAIFFGYEIGLLPLQALQSIAVINGKPSIYGDAALALVRGRNLLEDFEEVYTGGELWLEPPEYDNFGKQQKPGKPNPEYKALCKIKRKGSPRLVVYEFSVGDALLAGLWNKEGPWRQYTKRMLKFRARGFGLRDEFPDTLRGLILAEEAEDYGDLRDVTPTKEEPPKPPAAEVKAEAVAEAKAPRKRNNKFQEDDAAKAKEQATDAEVISETTTADAKPKEEPKPVEAEKVTEAKPKEEAKPAPVDDGEFLAKLLEEVGANAPLKKHLEELDKLLGGTHTLEDMKKAWADNKKWNGTKTEINFVQRLKDHHKDRVVKADLEALPKEEAPTPPAGAKFDVAGFLHGLDVALGKEETQDAVNTCYTEMMSEPLRAGLITAEDEENDFKPMLQAHLERLDF